MTRRQRDTASATVPGVPLQLQLTATGELDLATALGDDEVDALETAALLSLRTDARAGDDDEVPDDASRRGYWGDAYDTLLDARDPPGPLGSRLWLLETALATEPNARRAEAYALEALAWMRDGKLVRDIAATCTATGERLNLEVVITPRRGRKILIRMPLGALAV